MLFGRKLSLQWSRTRVLCFYVLRWWVFFSHLMFFGVLLKFCLQNSSPLHNRGNRRNRTREKKQRTLSPTKNSVSLPLTTPSSPPKILYLWLQISMSFFLPSTISSKKSSICPAMLSVPDFNTPIQPFKFSILSRIPVSDSHSISPWDLLSSSPLSSSMAILAFLNSYIKIPWRPSILLISATTLCCSLAVETMNADPKNKQPSTPLWELNSGQQQTVPHSNIIRSRELTFLIAKRTPLNPLNPLNLDSKEIFSSNRSESCSILVSINTLFSSSNPMASLRQPMITRITYMQKRSI